jgi:hypothetical protein
MKSKKAETPQPCAGIYGTQFEQELEKQFAEIEKRLLR